MRGVLRGALATLLLLPAVGCGGSTVTPTTALGAQAAVQARAPEGLATPAPTQPIPSPQVPAGLPSPVAATYGPASADPPVGPGGVGGPDRSPASGRGGGSGGPSGDTVAGPSAGPRTDRFGPAPASCARLRSQTGIDASTVRIANIADVSGPIPGIFKSARDAVRAYVAYFNASATLCGRRLELLTLDSNTDPASDQRATQIACERAFASVGSMSAFDVGGAATADKCGLPDLRAISVSDARNECATCFGAQASDFHAFQNAVPDYFTQHYRSATQHAAILYVNASASVANAEVQRRAEEARGWRFVYAAGFDIAEFNYSPYVQRMRDAGVELLQFVGSVDQAVRLARAMEAGNYFPQIVLLDPTAYDPNFAAAGRLVEGAVIFIDFVPFEEAETNRELQRYLEWLQRVEPGAHPSYFGLFAWSAAKLWVREALALGGDLSRRRLVRRLEAVHRWSAEGLHAPQDVGGRTNSNCWRFLRLRNSVWVPEGGRAYLCRGSTPVG